jgi:hypothetical protein
MAKYSFNKEEFEAWKRAQQESADLQQKLNTSMKDYLATVKQIGELQKNIKYIEQQISKLKKEQNDYEDEIRKNGQKIRELRLAGYSAASDEVKVLKKQNEEIRKLIAAKRKSVDLTEHELEVLKKQTAELTEQVKQVNELSLGFNTISSALGAVPGLIKRGYGMLKGTGIFDMDKEIRNATRSMAGGQKTYNRMFNTISKASESTTMWGVGVKDLAIMQQGYTEAIGRSVMLTEDGLKAMAGIAEGTGLGKEYAVQLAGAMDNFNISAERTGKLVEDNMNIAAKLGVNGAAAMKSMQNNLKLAQKYNFKGGVAGLSKFSVEATKLKLDLEGISGMVDKVFRPEGAIEMAAELATMGGNFAALGDPMQLMFKARNDFEGFAKDIGKASAEFVQMNSETGEFTIKSGLAADRMREIARITGLSTEKLQEMAVQQAKFSEFRKSVGFNLKEEDAAMLETMSEFSEDKKGFVVNIKDREKLVKDLTKADLELLKAEEETLEERAKQARTFDETISDLILQFKQFLLPFAKVLKEKVGDRLQKLSDDWKKNGFYTSLKDFATKAAELAGSIGKFVLKAVEWLGPKGTLATIFGLKIAFNIGKWIANGMALAQGFNRVVNVGGGVPGSGFSNMSRGFGGGRGNFSSGQLLRSGSKNIMKGNFAKGGSRLLKGAGKGFAPLALVGAGMDLFSNMSDENLSGGEGLLKTLDQNKGMALGAAIGSIIPGVGTLIGAGIGGIADMFMGEIGEYGNSKFKSSAEDNRFAGMLDGIMFHPNDKFMKVNDAVTIAGTSTSGNNKLAQELNSSNMNGEVNHNFKDLNIRITVDAPTDSEFWRSVVNQPDIMRRITEAVHISTEEAASGKISGKPKQKFKA